MAVKEELLTELRTLQKQQAALAQRRAELERELGALANGNGSPAKPGLGALYGKWKGQCPELTDEDFDALNEEWMREINDIIEAQEEDKQRR